MCWSVGENSCSHVFWKLFLSFRTLSNPMPPVSPLGDGLCYGRWAYERRSILISQASGPYGASWTLIDLKIFQHKRFSAVAKKPLCPTAERRRNSSTPKSPLEPSQSPPPPRAWYRNIDHHYNTPSRMIKFSCSAPSLSFSLSPFPTHLWSSVSVPYNVVCVWGASPKHWTVQKKQTKKTNSE